MAEKSAEEEVMLKEKDLKKKALLDSVLTDDEKSAIAKRLEEEFESEEEELERDFSAKLQEIKKDREEKMNKAVITIVKNSFND